MAGAVINMQQIISIGTGVVRANDPSHLKEFGGSVELSEGCARRLLAKLNWCKRKATTDKVEPSSQYLAEETFSFQREISTAEFNNDIPPELVINLDQTPLSYRENIPSASKGLKTCQLKTWTINVKLRRHLH